MIFKNSLPALIVLATAAYFGTMMVNAQDCARTYTVQLGDTCNSICAAQHVPTYQLMTVNKDLINPECNNLVPGETLCLGLVGSDCTEVYVVVQDDSLCIDIADKHNLTVSDLLAQNPNIDTYCSNLLVGEVLCVAPANK